MSETLSLEQTVEILSALCRDMEAAKDSLNDLDSAVGDGDIGISISYGFRAVRGGLTEYPGDIGKVLVGAGVHFADAAGATIGALLSTAFLRAGREVQGRAEVGLPELVSMVQAAEAGVRARGRAAPGDKTMLDALSPAVRALEVAAQEGLSLREALERAATAAEAGMNSTKDMVAAFGRARWLGERTVGHQDPGATVIYLIFKSVLKQVTGITPPP